MADKMLRVAGRGADGTAKPIKTSNSGVVETQAVDSSVVMKEFKADTAMLSSVLRGYGENVTSITAVTPIDVRNFKKKAIFIRNSHDKTITVEVRLHADTISTTNGGVVINPFAAEVSIPAGQSVYLSSDEYPILNEPCIGLSVVLVATSVMTTGTLDLIILGGRV